MLQLDSLILRLFFIINLKNIFKLFYFYTLMYNKQLFNNKG